MRRERFDKMNVVPFIDIVLVLLVIVLATATFVQHKSIKVDLPGASHAQSKEPQSIVVTIDKQGRYFLGTRLVTFAELQTRLKDLDPKKDKLSLHTDKAAPFDYFVKVVDILKARGFAFVDIVTQP